jgi:hypothetical protein
MMKSVGLSAHRRYQAQQKQLTAGSNPGARA